MTYDHRLSASADIEMLHDHIDAADHPRARALVEARLRRSEPRVVFQPSGARAHGLARGADEGDCTVVTAVSARDPAFDLIAEPDRVQAPAGATAVSCGDAKTVVFIDAAGADLTAILRAASTDGEIVLLDEASDGLEQIAAHLQCRAGIEVVHIVGPGQPGALYLGSAVVTPSSIREVYVERLATIRSALVAEADLLVYGCDATGGAAGQALVLALTQATGTRVLASACDETGVEEARLFDTRDTLTERLRAATLSTREPRRMPSEAMPAI